MASSEFSIYSRIWVLLFFFPCLIAVATISSTVLNRSFEREHPCLKDPHWFGLVLVLYHGGLGNLSSLIRD